MTVQDNSAENGKNKIKPLLLVGDRCFDYYGSVIANLLGALTNMGLNTGIVCSEKIRDAGAIPQGVEVLIHPEYKLPLLGQQNLKALLGKLDNCKPDILHCFCGKTLPLCVSAAKAAELPFVLTLNEMAKLPDGQTLAGGNCAAVAVPSETVGDYVRKNIKKYKGTVQQIRPGCYAENTCACFREPEQLTSMLVVHPLKSLAELSPLFNAVRHLAIDGYEFVLVIIGTGKAELKIRKHLKTLGLSHIVNIVPTLNRSRAAFSGADIFIRPRPVNNFDAYLLEAMSVGTAVAACTGGVDDLLINEQTTVLFDPEDELSIYAILQRLLDDKTASRNLAGNAQRYVREQNSVNAMAQAYLNLYNSVLGSVKKANSQ